MAKSPATEKPAAQPATPPSATDAGETHAVPHPALVVKASLPRRHRAGRAFGPHPVTIEAGTLTARELKAIMDDPYLGVSEAARSDPKPKD